MNADSPRIMAKMARLLHLIVIFVLWTGLSACRTIPADSGTSAPGEGYWPTEQEKKLWIKRERLVEASSEETAIARDSEAPFKGNKASVPGGPLAVVFKMGVLKTFMGPNGYSLCTTTSVYDVKNLKSGISLAKSASTLSAGLGSELGYNQKVWFSSDRTHVLIYDSWCDGGANHDTYALISKSPNGGNWQVRYLKIPEFTGYPGVNDHGSLPIGFSGHDLIFNPLVTDKAYKRKIADFEEADPPLPFTIG